MRRQLAANACAVQLTEIARAPQATNALAQALTHVRTTRARPH